MTASKAASISVAALNLCARRVELLVSVPRDLSVLRSIENVLDELQAAREFAELVSSVIKEATDEVKALKSRHQLDKDGSTSEKLFSAQKSLQVYCDLLKMRRESARMDPQLREEDGVFDEFCKSIAAIAELHNNINASRLAIGMHDVKYSKVIGEFDSIEKLKAFLDA